MTRIIFIICMFIYSVTATSQYTVKGIVVNDQNEAIDFASVFIADSDYAISTIQDGSFIFEGIQAGTYLLKVSYIGYETVQREIVLDQNIDLVIVLSGTIYSIDEIQIDATKAQEENPVAFTNVKREEIEDGNLGQDIPYLLQWQPSITVTSDAGAGIGYTGIRVRGSDATRTNVTLNGVPLNDSESQGVFWVDLPDFLTNVSSIQIQRGVGVSTTGTSAFGATINLNTDNYRQNSFAILSSSVGSFNTSKFTAHFGTGLMNNKYALEARFSKINSAGYIDRASSDLSSYYISAMKISEGSSLKFNLFSGGEITYQAWDGLPYQYLEADRTYNAAGTEKSGDPYDNQIDNYRQIHAQLIYNKELTAKSKLNLTAHMTSGKGFYESYRSEEKNIKYGLFPDSIVQDIVTQKWLNNIFFGIISAYEYENDLSRLVVGAAANEYDGLHFGDVIWTENNSVDSGKSHRYYTNDARKREANVYARFTSKIWDKVIPFIDMQYRIVNYRYDGLDKDGVEGKIIDQLNFFNPKVGISYYPAKKHKVFAFYGITNREPGRNEYVGSTPQNRPKHETLNDFEIGYSSKTKYVDVDLTLFDMQYKDQLVPTGELDDVGELVRVNVDQSFRRGIELGLLGKVSTRFKLGYYMTLSKNKIITFTEYIDNWDTWESEVFEIHNNSDLAYSPNQLHTVTANFVVLPATSKHKLSVQANYKYVGSQFLDNTGNEFSQLDPFSYLDGMIFYSTSLWKIKNLAITLKLNNILNSKYVSNGWIYRFRSDSYNPVLDNPYAREEAGGIYNQTGLYPQATTNFLLGFRVEF